jgi:hypothetical protein
MSNENNLYNINDLKKDFKNWIYNLDIENLKKILYDVNNNDKISYYIDSEEETFNNKKIIFINPNVYLPLNHHLKKQFNNEDYISCAIAIGSSDFTPYYVLKKDNLFFNEFNLGMLVCDPNCSRISMKPVGAKLTSVIKKKKEIYNFIEGTELKVTIRIEDINESFIYKYISEFLKYKQSYNIKIACCHRYDTTNEIIKKICPLLENEDYYVDNNVPSRKCDEFILNFCNEDDNAIFPLCGCSKNKKTNDNISNNIQKIIYNKYPMLNKACLISECINPYAYKFNENINQKCSSLCFGIFDVNNDGYANVNIDNVKIKVQCGNDGIIINENTNNEDDKKEDDKKEDDKKEDNKKEDNKKDDKKEDNKKDNKKEDNKKEYNKHKYTYIMISISVLVLLIILFILKK